MTDRLLIIGVSLAVGIALGSCDRLKSPMPELQKPPATSTAPAPTPAPTEGERRAFAQSAQTEIDELRAGMAELRTRADQASQETRAKLELELDLLENQLREVQQKLVDLGSATVDTWVALKETFKKALEQLKSDLGSYRKSAA
jgi:DNA-binding transcriptional MerR regulator